MPENKEWYSRVPMQNTNTMNKLIKQIPNFITSGNLLCGSFSIVAAFSGRLDIAAWLIILGSVFDFFDGMVARLLKAQSPIGKELDSLADLISFGLAPAVIIFHLLLNSNPSTSIEVGGYPVIAFFAFILVPFTAYRLAKFNTDSRQHSSFIGLPSPGSALFLLSFPLIIKYQAEVWPSIVIYFVKSWFLLLSVLLMSLMMVAELPLFSLKFAKGDPQNRFRIIFMVISAILLLALHYIAIPLIIVLYIVLSIWKR